MSSIAQMQAKDLTHEDSLLQLPFRGNCLNWVLGHMLSNRDAILGWLGEAPVGGERAARYRQESDPVTGLADDMVPLDELAGTAGSFAGKDWPRPWLP